MSVLLLVNHGDGTASAAKNSAGANNPAPRSSASAPAPTASDSLSPVSQNSPETVAPVGGASASAAGTPASAAKKASKPAASKYVKYTVKPGDNLFVIADWFHQKGYQPIYQWNQTTIGKDPSLIRPGQTLIVAVRS
ncbi:LysM peptidoglycan-binding domain-containing protein [uncultured Jatrophihabitans sp.]|uniref:LysM peptidoglycan-binding domain-containing protein n=1 Tax=uncultured Jatrophihabitans sp. TaxID=1610747 RepID=UPI0035CBC0A9